MKITWANLAEMELDIPEGSFRTVFTLISKFFCPRMSRRLLCTKPVTGDCFGCQEYITTAIQEMSEPHVRNLGGWLIYSLRKVAMDAAEATEVPIPEVRDDMGDRVEGADPFAAFTEGYDGT